MGPTSLKPFAGKKHFSGFYLKWKLFPRVMSAEEMQIPAQVSALKTGLWAPFKYCRCTCHEQRKAAQALKRLHPCFETEGLLELRGYNQGKRNNYLVSSPLTALFLQPLSALGFNLCLKLHACLLVVFPPYVNWGWQVRHKVKELEITCKTMEPERQSFSWRWWW